MSDSPPSTAPAPGSTRPRSPRRTMPHLPPGSPTPTAARCCTTRRAAAAFAARGWTMRGLVADTALSAFLVLPGQRSYDLSDLDAALPAARAARRRRVGRRSAIPGRRRRAGPGGRGGGARPAVLDLSDRSGPRPGGDGGGARLLPDVELPLVSVLAEMERVGIAADDDTSPPVRALRRRGQARSRPPTRSSGGR